MRFAELKFNASNSLARALWQFLGAVLLAIYVVAGNFWLKIEPPVLITLVIVFSRLSPGFMQAQQSINQWLHTLPLIENVQQLLRESQAAAEPLKGRDFPFLKINRSICLKNVSFTYGQRGKPSIESASLTIPALSTTAIIGPSGAGKSTLGDILVGLLAPESGELQVDGTTISPKLRHSWMQSAAYIP